MDARRLLPCEASISTRRGGRLDYLDEVVGLHLRETFELFVELLKDLADGSHIEFHELEDLYDLLADPRNVVEYDRQRLVTTLPIRLLSSHYLLPLGAPRKVGSEIFVQSPVELVQEGRHRSDLLLQLIKEGLPHLRGRLLLITTTLFP